MTFSHVALNCRDLAATEAFYEQQLGFQRVRRIDLGDSSIVFLRLGDVRLELFQSEEDRPDEHSDGPARVGVRHLAFQVADLDAALKQVEAAAPLTLGPLDFDSFIPGWRSAWLTDPDGRVIEISQGYADDPALDSSLSKETQP
ncbi:VOC family protein (plasmid) [Deinococcus sp. KNUC1210]|uniref:VOC family protein n=1 Tax=Deinococcus sp. KNUC1210 TaxID=2917691 RepID=UPI001EF08DDC|nr:VOC family protein [Deinococcus sp. KNUC1210]ULH17771.1 VOC family protein [Deinococcus sp. KNUC1210]